MFARMYVCVFACVSMYICMPVDVRACVGMCMCMYVYVCMHVCVYVSVYVCMCLSQNGAEGYVPKVAHTTPRHSYNNKAEGHVLM